MPYLREHAARMKSPRSFLRGTFRSKALKPGLRLIVAKRCSRCPMQTQAIRFNVCRYTAAQAKTWLRKYRMKPVRFEAATKKCGR